MCVPVIARGLHEQPRAFLELEMSNVTSKSAQLPASVTLIVHVDYYVSALFVWTLKFASFHLEPQTRNVAKYNWNFSQFASFSSCPWHLGLLHDQSWLQLLFIVNDDGIPRWPSSLGLWWTVYSSSPHCCYGTEGSKPDHPDADVISTFFFFLGSTAMSRREGVNKVIGFADPLLHDTSWKQKCPRPK